MSRNEIESDVFSFWSLKNRSYLLGCFIVLVVESQKVLKSRVTPFGEYKYDIMIFLLWYWAIENILWHKQTHGYIKKNMLGILF